MQADTAKHESEVGDGDAHRIPSAYVEGFARASRIDPALARHYALGTMVGDPPADRAMRDLARVVPANRIHSTIAACMHGDGELPPEVPDSLRELIADAQRLPSWYDREVARVAARAFARNATLLLLSLVSAAIVEGFSTRISRSFRVRGRLIDNGLRRLSQNNRRLFEQFLPGGMEPGADGWRATLRIRLVHAQSRRLFREFDDWPIARLGVPLHASHMALGCAAFSGRLMHHAVRLGGDFTADEREAYVHVWRWAAELLGVPEQLAFVDMASALRLFDVASLSEPPADYDSIIMANSIINSAPLLLGYTEPAVRRQWAARLYAISRALIGEEAAESLRYPTSPRRLNPIAPLRFFRWKYRLARILSGVMPPKWAAHPFLQPPVVVLMNATAEAGYDLSYALPTALHDEDSDRW